MTSANPNWRFTILTFPQFFDGENLKVNVVFLPRNQNPLKAAIEGEAPAIPDAPAFADAELSFVARIIPELSGLPSPASALPPIPLTIYKPTLQRELFDILGNDFAIGNKGAANTNVNINNYPKRTPDPVSIDRSVKKYLPFSYRRSFNFVAPRTPNAVIDESYRCQVRAAKPNPTFQQSPEEISWGQVFAYALRQPLLARKLGIIFENITIEGVNLPKGGWLYIDLADDSDYKTQQNKADEFIKKYAARIPPLEGVKKRNLFAAVQFPVLPLPVPGNYDGIFVEASEYDDGFAKVVHAFQPVSSNLLLEEPDSFHPVKEAGIRLGWDDEQILIWYMRQMMEDTTVGSQKRIDAPLGVFGYRIDVREKADPVGPWLSLNAVKGRHDLELVDRTTGQSEQLGPFDGELTYQVYPTQLDGDSTKNYWLPMYFANWSGKSMVLPDEEASAIYQTDKVAPAQATTNKLNEIYKAAPIATSLRYGKIYQFRVRLGDLSGNGPGVNDEPAYEAPSAIATCHFKRFVAPGMARIANLPTNTDEKYFEDAELKIKRPLLGYPAVVFTGKYANAVPLLKQASLDMTGKEAFGIADPDVDSVEVIVELQTLKMDNLMSVSGQESYIKFYTTVRNFPKASNVFEDELVIPIEYRDSHVLNFGDAADLGDLGLSQAQIDAMDGIVLPTARVVRLTVRPVCEEKEVGSYYGLEKEDHEFNTRYGRTRQFLLYKPSENERDLFIETSPAEKIRGIFLKPDPPFVHDGQIESVLLGRQTEKSPDMIQRLAQQLDLESTGLTLTGRKGHRVQFGCSNRIRHTLSPDNSSLTFASKGDLINHWLCCITLHIDRDWTWDALEDTSLVVSRKTRFKEDADTETLYVGPVRRPTGASGRPKPETIIVGDVEIKKTVPFIALSNPKRDNTTVVFIDAVEPKGIRKDVGRLSSDPPFPDVIEVEYTVTPNFKPNHGAQKDPDGSLQLELPITSQPAQVPKIVSAGLALSPYQRNEKYSATQPRRRFLWIEFEEPVRDPKDAYFARVLAYAPDQLISNNNPELFRSPEEPALPVDPEYIRVISPDQSNDDAGLDAMQPMEKAVDSDKHYLLPLPPALHSESAELFGFFTYEFRVGHFKYTDSTDNHEKGESVWTTAQGRFGRALRATGVQHPAPTLTCTVNRDEEKLYVTAPYAVAVHKGKNVTSDPPRTEIWCLLYAQVRQADNKDLRNILLDDRMLDPLLRVNYGKQKEQAKAPTVEEQRIKKKAVMRNWDTNISVVNLAPLYQVADLASTNKDATKYGTVVWSNGEVSQLLDIYGLPQNSSLSVLCVEILPQITNLYDHVDNIKNADTQNALRQILQPENVPSKQMIADQVDVKEKAAEAVYLERPKPLSDRLGHHRILRTSALSEVPFVCTRQ